MIAILIYAMLLAVTGLTCFWLGVRRGFEKGYSAHREDWGPMFDAILKRMEQKNEENTKR